MNSKYSIKIIVALVVFVAVVVAHAAVGLGSLWIITAGALAGVAGILAPERQPQEALEAPPKPSAVVSPVESLQEMRTRTKRLKQSIKLSGEQRQEFFADLDHFFRTCRDVVQEWDHLAADSLQEEKVRRIMDIYFPETCRILEEMPGVAHRQAVEDFRASLAVLQTEIDEVHKAILRDNLQELKDNRTFLELQFGVVRKPEE
ncbi:putative secreted protein [Corynebacterium jeikeium K411]|uniref:Putative secreted protein n=1 Tax=Corynebacterium jeikeium (strain K411) TaxID=306537 RepID=Q4JVY8_CORJK|nr:hypothetical protein [Corynebacterium jeikeium]CAI37019.1 putative secreted protein [Corynebacterium jeikeium K411]